MALRSDATHWGTLAKAFHWIIVLLILVQAAIGLVMVELAKPTPKPSVIPYYTFHKSLGLTILLLALLRLGWRAFDRHPQQPPTMPHWQAVGARIGHALLYTLLFVVPLSGWLFDSASGLRPLIWWGVLKMPKLAAPDKHLADVFAATHEWLFWTLALVAAGHAAFALVHHFVNRDDVLRRMLPAWRAEVPAQTPVSGVHRNNPFS